MIVRRGRGLSLLLAGLAIAAIAPTASGQVKVDAGVLGDLAARAIGPAVMSGRIAAIDAVSEVPITIFVGAAGGGVWRSTDGGIAFEAVFDDHNQSIGAIKVDPSDPEVVWVGSGESWTRNSVSVGDGVYKSTDGGDSWRNVGLGDSERIARIVINPEDGDRVFVCATGHLWNANQERGVYRTTDGGETWEQMLFVDEDTGCADIAIDLQDPRILYAAMWQFRRRPDFFTSGGPGSGLYKSTDGGDTWRELTNGLPEGEKGRIAIGVAPSRPSVVYAVVEAEQTALYRSDDLGESWTEVSSSANVRSRPFYFAHLVVDPTDFNRVYKPGSTLTVSTDGGATFSQGLAGAVHSDHHALWINPDNPHQLLLGTDGGLYVSHDRGNGWRHMKALPISQFYEVAYDMEWPYNVYGGLQDNGSWRGPSRAISGIQNRDWRNIGVGDGFHAIPDPSDSDLVYVEYQGGNVMRFQPSTGVAKRIKPYPAEGEPDLRFNWNTPIHLSTSQPGTIYLGTQYLFRSRDRGDSWERVSPDLTTNDPEKQQQKESGGLTIDNSTAENHTTIYTISESPLNPDVIWVGTDDGNLQVTRDGGGTWENVVGKVAGLPKYTWVSHVEAGHHQEGTAYVTFDGHRTGDMSTYAYRTRDFGESWESVVGGGGGESGSDTGDEDSPIGHAHVIREDLERPELLFLGTELGLFLSFDGGLGWTPFTGNLPRVSVRDIAIHPREHDLILATHGRGIYILDDITPLRHLSAEVLEEDLAILPTRPAAMVLPASVQAFSGDDEFVGPNPPEAATIAYYLRRRHMFGDFVVEVFDGDGNLVATPIGGKRRGINRVNWPMRSRPPKVPPATSMVPQPFSFVGPRVPDGTYTVRITKGDIVAEGEVTLVPDPRSTYTPEGRSQQDEAAWKLYGLLGRLTYVVEGCIDLREQATERSEALGDEGSLARRLGEYAQLLDEFREGLVSTSDAGMLAGEERLREKLVDLYGSVNGYEGRPTDSQLLWIESLETELEAAEARFAALTGEDLDELSSRLQEEGLDPLKLMSRDEWETQ